MAPEKISVDRTIARAKSHAQKGEVDQARELYNVVLENFPKNARAIEGLNALQTKASDRPANAVTQEALNNVIALYSGGRLNEAMSEAQELIKVAPNVPALHNLLGAIYAGLEQLEQSAASYRRALAIKPDFAQGHNNLGVVLNSSGKHSEAVASYQRALKINPDYAESYNNLGNALNDLGKNEEAIASFRRALEIKPDFADAHNNLGVALKDLGRHEEAMASYRRALEIKADFAGAHNNLGVALKDLGKNDEAAACYRKTLKIKPDYADAHYNLGKALEGSGKYEEAIAGYREAARLEPGNRYFWQSLSAILKKLKFASYSEERAFSYCQLLDRETAVRPSQIARPAIALLKQHPHVKRAIDFSNAGKADLYFRILCTELSEIPLLLRILELSPIPDPELENLLTQLRKAVLENMEEAADDPSLLKFQSALALQSFTNEFVFSETKEETEMISSLEDEISSTIQNNKSLRSLKISCLAAYRPLHAFAWSHKLSVPEHLGNLFKRQVQEVLEERTIRLGIPCLKPIEDRISNAVRSQYEESPYPRWINTELPVAPHSIQILAKQLDLNLDPEFQNFPDAPTILVAGCGTGQHPLVAAAKFSGSKVLAVDLSLSSLSYAARRTRELGVSNIDYMQADILDLRNLRRQFDIIESVGVLHHMADPMAGWTVLTDCLKPGGLMMIGLYSETARRHIVAARHIIAQQGLTGSPEDIRTFRRSILNSDTDEFSGLNPIADLSDFYDMSGCRDLLFHVQEHRFTLPKIAAALHDLDLKFLGFEFSDEAVKQQFHQQNPSAGAQYMLDVWQEFETDNPFALSGMYQFWAQKK